MLFQIVKHTDNMGITRYGIVTEVTDVHPDGSARTNDLGEPDTGARVSYLPPSTDPISLAELTVCTPADLENEAPDADTAPSD